MSEPTEKQIKKRQYNKKWKADNKEKVSEGNRLYKIKNNDIIKIKNNEKKMCLVCNKEYTHSNKVAHLKSKYHLKHTEGYIDDNKPKENLVKKECYDYK